MHKLIVLFSILSMIFSFPTWAQSIYSPNTTIAEFIKDATQRIHKSIDHSGISPKVPTLQAANQLSVIMGNLQIAFSSQILQPVSTLAKEDRFYFRTVADLVAQLERGTQLAQLEQAAMKKNEQLSQKKLPLLLKDINTVFLTTHQDRPLIQLTGDFPDDYVQIYKPVTTFSSVEEYPTFTSIPKDVDTNHVIIKAITKIKVEATPNVYPITFEMPVSKYLPQPEQNLDIQKVIFALPYPDHSEQTLTATYTFWLGTPPNSPGSIQLIQKQQQTTAGVQAKQTRSYTQHAATKDIIETYCVPKTDQTALITSSVEFIVEQSQGKKDQDWSYYRQQSDQNICFVVETFNQNGGTSGQLNFHLAYQINHKKDQESNHKKMAVLKWQDTQTFPLTGQDWQLIFTDYLGRHKHFKRPIQKDLIQIAVQDNQLIISTPPVTKHWR